MLFWHVPTWSLTSVSPEKVTAKSDRRSDLPQNINPSSESQIIPLSAKKASERMSYPNHRDVGEFHHKFNLDHTDCHSAVDCSKLEGPRTRNEELLKFRVKFLTEELEEFLDGAQAGDDAKMFDALLDLVYVAMGTAHLLGYPWQEGWDEVQRANMQKERCQRAEDSTRGSTFDVMKPPGWTPPDIVGILRRFGWPT